MNLPFNIPFTPATFQILCLLVFVFNKSVFLIMGSKALKIFPDINDVTILFREKWASGNSNDQPIHKLGGASNILEIVITEHELWIKAPKIFAGFMSFFGLIRKVKTGDLISLNDTKNSLSIKFKNQDGSTSEMNLKLKSAKQFIKIVSDKNPSATVINKV